MNHGSRQQSRPMSEVREVFRVRRSGLSAASDQEGVPGRFTKRRRQSVGVARLVTVAVGRLRPEPRRSPYRATQFRLGVTQPIDALRNELRNRSTQDGSRAVSSESSVLRAVPGCQIALDNGKRGGADTAGRRRGALANWRRLATMGTGPKSTSGMHM